MFSLGSNGLKVISNIERIYLSVRGKLNDNNISIFPDYGHAHIC